MVQTAAGSLLISAQLSTAPGPTAGRPPGSWHKRDESQGTDKSHLSMGFKWDLKRFDLFYFCLFVCFFLVVLFFGVENDGGYCGCCL